MKAVRTTDRNSVALHCNERKREKSNANFPKINLKTVYKCVRT